MELTIRKARYDDAALLAWCNSAMAEETEGKSLDPDVVGQGVRNLLGDPAMGRYWVAEADGQVVGQLMVTYEWSDWRNGVIWWIQSVFVQPDWRRRGIFSALYRHVQALAIDAPGVIGLRLYVERENIRAQRTYEALGMVKPNYLVMESLFGQRPGGKEN